MSTFNDFVDRVLDALVEVRKFKDSVLKEEKINIDYTSLSPSRDELFVGKETLKLGKPLKRAENVDYDGYGPYIEELLKHKWIEKIGLRYRPSKGKYQVDYEKIFFFLNLANYLDGELRRHGSSLEKRNEVYRNNYIERKKRHDVNQGFDIFDNLFVISKNHVYSKYTGGDRSYDVAAHYEYLSGQLGEEISNSIMYMGFALEVDLPEADPYTKAVFNLTENGLAKKWWDGDGDLRESLNIGFEEQLLLDYVNERRTKVWSYPVMKELIISLFLELINTIENYASEENLKEKDYLKILSLIFDGREEYISIVYEDKVTDSLLKLSENGVRKAMPQTTGLSMEKDIENLRENLSTSLLTRLKEKIEEFQANIPLEAKIRYLDSLIEEKPEQHKLRASRILMSSKSESYQLLDRYWDYDFGGEMLKRIFKDTEDENLKLLALLYLDRGSNLSGEFEKELYKKIHPSNIETYKKFIKDYKGPFSEKLDIIKEFINPKRKDLVFDRNKLAQSREELNRTVKKLSVFIDDKGEDQEEVFEDIEIEPVEKNSVPYLNLLEDLLTNGFVSEDDLKELANREGMLIQAYVKNINDFLYDYVNDQTLILEDGKLVIDEFYVDIIEELVKGGQ